MGFRDRLKTLRNAAGFRQKELAERCGWPGAQGRIANYESGLREPYLEDVAVLARALGVTPAMLAFGSDSPTGLTDDEMALVRAWRMASPDGKSAINGLLRALKVMDSGAKRMNSK